MNAWLKKFWDSNKVFLGFLIVIILFRVSIADQYHVPSGSMEPTIAIGDRILVNKLAYHFKVPFTNILVKEFNNPQRGDIVVFEKPGDHTVMVKRLIGLPGDFLEIDGGFVRINGETFFENGKDPKEALQDARMNFSGFLYNETMSGHVYTIQRLPYRDHFPPIQMNIPEDHFFFMGDNRDNSNDSRAWGIVPRELLKGKAMRVFYSMVLDGVVPKFNWSRTWRDLYQPSKAEE